jgi:hypothetical protein
VLTVWRGSSDSVQGNGGLQLLMLQVLGTPRARKDAARGAVAVQRLRSAVHNILIGALWLWRLHSCLESVNPCFFAAKV